MKLIVAGQVPTQYDASLFRRIIAAIQNQLNGLSEGRMAVNHFTATSEPTTGSFQQGDRVVNSTPAEAGSPGSKYVMLGWVCVSPGSPGTLKEMRFLTGN